jgi:hypothetical protein
MARRLITTVAILAFAVGAFFGAGPTEAGPLNSFGICFLGLAVLVWFAWKPMMAGLSQSHTGVIDAFGRNIMGDHARKTSSGGGSNS